MRRIGDESGATAVIVALLLVVMIGITALTVDGGLLWVKFRRVRNANDAAALAAALSCAKSEGQAAADAIADDVATANVIGVTPVEVNVYTPGCDAPSGTVHVEYGGTQGLLFGPAVGVSSPRDVVGSATAIWGGAGGSGDIIPMTLMRDRLSTCNVVPSPGNPTPPVGTRCGFWWDDAALGAASWGLMNLASWGTNTDPSGCSATGGTNAMTDAILNGLGYALLLETIPTYVCAENGAQMQPLDNAIRTALANGRTVFVLPINDSTQQINDANGNPYKYAIIGFAILKPVDLYRPNEAGYSFCASAIPPEGDSANSRCLVAEWVGFSTAGLVPGGGPNFGLIAVGLSE